MGASNHGQYILSQHATDRYLERIDNSKTDLQALKDVRSMLQHGRLLGRVARGNESWLCEERNIVIIIDPSQFKVVTIYSSLDEYSHNEEPTTKEISVHPKVEKIIANASKDAYKKQERYYFAKLEPMYKEYADRIGKLSRTSNQEVFDDKKIELDDLQKDISRVVADKNKVLNDLKQFTNL